MRPALFVCCWPQKKGRLLNPPNAGQGPRYWIATRPPNRRAADGDVPGLMATRDELYRLRSGRMTRTEFRDRLLGRVGRMNLRPGALSARCSAGRVLLCDGDSLLCVCGIRAAANGVCHRTWIVPYLVGSGWSVILDGEPIATADAVTRCFAVTELCGGLF